MLLRGILGVETRVPLEFRVLRSGWRVSCGVYLEGRGGSYNATIIFTTTIAITFTTILLFLLLLTSNFYEPMSRKHGRIIRVIDLSLSPRILQVARLKPETVNPKL